MKYNYWILVLPGHFSEYGGVEVTLPSAWQRPLEGEWIKFTDEDSDVCGSGSRRTDLPQSGRYGQITY
jgi:hypothetical protein